MKVSLTYSENDKESKKLIDNGHRQFMKNGKIEIELKCNNYIPHENWLVFFSVFKRRDADRTFFGN